MEVCSTDNTLSREYGENNNKYGKQLTFRTQYMSVIRVGGQRALDLLSCRMSSSYGQVGHVTSILLLPTRSVYCGVLELISHCIVSILKANNFNLHKSLDQEMPHLDFMEIPPTSPGEVETMHNTRGLSFFLVLDF